MVHSWLSLAACRPRLGINLKIPAIQYRSDLKSSHEREVVNYFEMQTELHDEDAPRPQQYADCLGIILKLRQQLLACRMMLKRRLN